MVAEMDRSGWAVMPGCLGLADSLNLRTECEDACERGEFRRAGVGRGAGLEVRGELRQDKVLWLDAGGSTTVQGLYLARLELLRLALNRRLFLGLFDFEGHFAVYPEGAFYKPHLDRHAGTAAHSRVVTAILYLNENWVPGDGGELKLWTVSGEKEGAFQLIEPQMGTLVCFLAGEFWHEVLPARKIRMSITGWFSGRGEAG